MTLDLILLPVSMSLEDLFFPLKDQDNHQTTLIKNDLSDGSNVMDQTVCHLTTVVLSRNTCNHAKVAHARNKTTNGINGNMTMNRALFKEKGHPLPFPPSHNCYCKTKNLCNT
jgi:hypothetical protein